MPSPLTVAGFQATDLHQKIDLLIDNLINIKDETGHFLLKLPDGRIIDTKGWNDWEWTHGIGLYGLYQYHCLRPSSPALDIVQQWFKDRLAEGTTKNINTMSAFLTLAYVSEQNGDQSYLPWLDSWAEWAMHDLPRTTYGGMQHITYLEENHDQLWEDTLITTVMPLAKIGILLRRPRTCTTHQLGSSFMVGNLTRLRTEVWDTNFHERGGRSATAGWLTIAIPDFIELLDLPPDDSVRMYLVGVLEAQCRALKRLQAPNGMWRTLLDVSEEEGSYQEASATAGFAYGLLKSIRRRYISSEYTGFAMKALKAVIERIRSDGELKEVSFGTGMGRDLDHYINIERTSMPYGQAMAIMALVEFLRVFI